MIRSAKAVATLQASGTRLREIGYARTSMLEIVAPNPVTDIVESHRKIVQWGWAALHA